MVEDLITVNLYRHSVIVETVHEIIATFHELGQLPRGGGGVRVGTSVHNHPIPDFGMEHSIDDTL